jgi:hypothetical protein
MSIQQPENNQLLSISLYTNGKFSKASSGQNFLLL